MRNITKNGHSLAAILSAICPLTNKMNALSLFMLCPLHFMQNFLFYFTHSANLPSQLEQNIQPMDGGKGDEMTTMGTKRSSISRGKTTATQPTGKVEAVEQLENGRMEEGHQNERGGRHNKNKHSQNVQERHGHDVSQGIHHDQHHIHVTTPRTKIHLPTVKLPPEPNRARNCDQLAHLCYVPMYRKVMQRECQKTCGTDECQDDREDLCIQWERRNFCTLRFYATMRWKCARTCRLCIPFITHK